MDRRRHTIEASRAQNVTRLAAEFVVIVIGVLTALAVDQVMERRQERELERELLLGFTENLRTDSIDYARLPELANGRAASAELLLRNLAPESRPGVRVAPALAALGPYEVPADDETIASAWRSVDRPSDLDVARGSYIEFSAGGAQRLIRNRSLRRRIHNYYYTVELLQKWDPWVTGAIETLADQTIEMGLSLNEPSAAKIRSTFARDNGSLVAALRYMQSRSLVQADIARRLTERASNLLHAIRDELAN